jgi:hypothetical protein
MYLAQGMREMTGYSIKPSLNTRFFLGQQLGELARTDTHNDWPFFCSSLLALACV